MHDADHAPSPSSIEGYLARLEVALHGADPALAHDALIDAEEHLQAAVRRGVPVHQAIEAYGSVDEIAAAYRGLPADPAGKPDETSGRSVDPPSSDGSPRGAPTAAVATPAQVPAPRLRDMPIVGIWFDSRAWGALLYFGGVGFVVATGCFVWAVVLGSLAIGLLPIVLGLPLLVLLLGSARALCLVEGAVVQALLGVRMPRRVQPVHGVADVGFWQRIWCWLKDVRSWLSLGYLYANFPVSVALFVVTITMSALSLAMVTGPLLQAANVPFVTLSSDVDRVQYLWTELKPAADGTIRLPMSLALSSVGLGLVLATITLWTMRGLGWIYGHVVQAIQVARPHAVPSVHR
jgi:hypothetical protein